MQKFKLHSSAVLAAILLLAAVFSVGCNNEPIKVQSLKSEKITELPDQCGGKNTYNVIILDSCEYIYCWFGAGNGGGSLTHKGNCKFCAARQHSR